MDTLGAHCVMEIYKPGSEVKHTSNQFLLASGNFQAPLTTKASEHQNAKRSLRRKLETPLTPQNSLQLVRNSWPGVMTSNVIFSLKMIRKPSLET